jgi:NAD(P)H dehydrogenase (quinone)
VEKRVAAGPVEERLLASGLDVVILQPAPYLQNLDPYLAAARRGSPMAFPYGAHTRLSMVDLRDVGQAAAAVVTGDEHTGGTYQLCGPDRLTAGEVWDRAMARFGIDSGYPATDADAWREGPGRELEGRVADWLASMFRYYDAHGLAGSSVASAALLRRAPHGLDDHLDELARFG